MDWGELNEAPVGPFDTPMHCSTMWILFKNGKNDRIITATVPSLMLHWIRTNIYVVVCAHMKFVNKIGCSYIYSHKNFYIKCSSTFLEHKLFWFMVPVAYAINKCSSTCGTQWCQCDIMLSPFLFLSLSLPPILSLSVFLSVCLSPSHLSPLLSPSHPPLFLPFLPSFSFLYDLSDYIMQYMDIFANSSRITAAANVAT